MSDVEIKGRSQAVYTLAAPLDDLLGLRPIEVSIQLGDASQCAGLQPTMPFAGVGMGVALILLPWRGGLSMSACSVGWFSLTMPDG